ncbi:MFS transporter [Streptomyces sp. p1417]|uniref:MFS transporter n=1 Tax=Streptomyces typhae TaxID=2681492 RepID=A0A6L6X922_9ACTN|nr:MFS transporter [Streptomyces typhae]MVO90435.1 MFS transporter [Streptomyces typhae]
MTAPTEQATEEVPDGTPAAALQEPAPDPKRWYALAVILCAAFMDLLDVTIVNVAITSIQKDIDAGYSAIAWITAGYTLAFAALLITGGRLGDIYGRKRMLLIGLGGFTAASVLCGVAPDPALLTGARIAQGATAGLMIPQVLSLIHVTFPRDERGKVLGTYGGIAGLALVLGPVIGGVLVSADLLGLAWRPIFLVNIPLGVVTFVAALLYVRESKAPDAPRLDLVGVLMATTAVLMLVYPLNQGRDLGWPLWTFAMMAGSAVVLMVFVGYERRLIARGGTPLIPLSLFRTRSFAGGFSVNLLYSVAYGTFFLMWSLYMQTGLGWSPLRSGLTALPMFLGLMVTAALAGDLLTPRFGRKVLFAGGALLVTGALFFVLVSGHYGPDISSWHMVAPLFVFGLGMGAVVAPVVDFALTDVPHKDAGSASGVLNTSGQLGLAVGIAMVAVVFLGVLPGQSGKGVDAAEPAIRHELTAAGVTDRAAQDDILAGYRTCTEDRLGEPDADAVPESCRGLPAGVTEGQSTAVLRALEDAGPDVRAETFARSFGRGLLYSAALFVIMTVIMVALPRTARPQET